MKTRQHQDRFRWHLALTRTKPGTPQNEAGYAAPLEGHRLPPTASKRSGMDHRATGETHWKRSGVYAVVGRFTGIKMEKRCDINEAEPSAIR